MKEKVIAVVVAVALVAAGALFFGGQDGKDGRDGRDGVGASSGPDKYQRQFFFQGFESGGVGASIASTTVEANVVLSASDWGRGIDYIEYNLTVGAVTLTTAASTTFPIGNERGSKREIWLYNATTTTSGDSVITLAAGTGIDLQEDTGQVITFVGLEAMRITFIRKADSDILMFVEATQVGD